MHPTSGIIPQLNFKDFILQYSSLAEGSKKNEDFNFWSRKNLYKTENTPFYARNSYLKFQLKIFNLTKVMLALS
jgi:hypothetical protein